MAGAGIVDHGTAESVTAEAAARIEDLARWGTPFDRDDFGNYELGKEAAHSRQPHRQGRGRPRRLGHHAGDHRRGAPHPVDPRRRGHHRARASPATMAASSACSAASSATAIPSRCFIRARATVLAAGGLGGLYAVTTNPPGVRGHAMGMAARAGALIADAEFVQFHPTAIATGADPAPLATEALRGEGAILVNDLGERFMPAIHPDAELAPRDIVARANFRQIKAGRKVFLDTRAGARRAHPHRASRRWRNTASMPASIRSRS